MIDSAEFSKINYHKNIMKKFFIVLSSAVVAFSLLGCRSETTADTSNQTNSNSLISIFSTDPANANTANVKVEETPLPVFTDAETALNEGKKLLDANQTEKAAAALKQAVKLNPELAEAYFNLGVAEALLEKEKAQLPGEESTPSKESVTAKKGKKEVVVMTQSEKAFDNAAKAYEKIIKKNPKDDAAYFNLGRAYNKLNKDKEAEKALRQAVKIKPDDSEYQTELGAILIKLSQYDDAVAVLKKAIQLDDTNSHAQDLLDKADAGQKRINFGIKPKPPENSARQKPAKSPTTDNSGNLETTPPKTAATPPIKSAPPATPAKPALNKKGN